MTERAVLYARVSGDDRVKEGRNLSSQIEMCREYALSKGYHVVAELSEDDRGARGSDFDLEQLNRALDMARNGEFEVLVVRELDRFSRSLAKQLVVENEFRQVGVQIEYVLGQYDDTPEGQLQKHVRAVIAEYERLKIAERTTRARFNFVRRGNVLCHGRPPFGYRLVENNGRRMLEIDESSAAVVRSIFHWYALGDENGEPLSIYSIAQRLSQQGIPTAADRNGGYKLNARGKWAPNTIAQILANETYAGVWRYGKERMVNGKHIPNSPDHLIEVRVPAIVTRALFDAASKRRQANKHLGGRRQKYQYLLSGRVRCGHCGRAMAGRTCKKNDKLFRYYYCHRRTPYTPRDCTNRGGYRVNIVDAAVWKWIEDWLMDPDKLSLGLSAYKQAREEELTPLRERLRVVEDLLKEHQTQLSRLLDLYLAGSFPEDLLYERQQRLDQAIQALRNERETLTATIDDRELTQEHIQSIKEFSEQVKNGLEAARTDFRVKRRVLEQLDVNVTLALENGNRVAHVTCILGEKQLLTSSTNR